MAIKVGQDLNRAQFAQSVGVALTTVDHWIRAGLPAVKKRGSVQINLKEAFLWVQERAKNEVLKSTDSLRDDDIIRRTRTAQMRIAEIQAATAEGEAITVQDWEREHADLVATFRAAIMAMPARHTSQFASRVLEALVTNATLEQREEARIIVEAQLRVIIDETLTRLSEVEEEETEESEAELATV